MGIAVAGRVKAGDRTDEQKPERAHQRTDRQLVFFGARLARNLVGILTVRKFGIVQKSRFVELPVSQAEYFPSLLQPTGTASDPQRWLCGWRWRHGLQSAGLRTIALPW
jgi:hypothetical protein